MCFTCSPATSSPSVARWAATSSSSLWRRAGARIPAAVFIDTKAGADTPEAREGREETIRLLGEDGFEPFWEIQAAKLFGPQAPPEVVERARQIASEQPITNLVATLQALAARPDSGETAASIDVPALVIVGEDDVLTPPRQSSSRRHSRPEGWFAFPTPGT